MPRFSSKNIRFIVFLKPMVYNSSKYSGRTNSMLPFIIGSMMLTGLIVGIYIGLKERYTANEGTCLLLVLETFFVSVGLILYGLHRLF